jgi:hypothetical protein
MAGLPPLRRKAISLHSYPVGLWRMHKAQQTAETEWIMPYIHLVQCPLCALIVAIQPADRLP